MNEAQKFLGKFFTDNAEREFQQRTGERLVYLSGGSFGTIPAHRDHEEVKAECEKKAKDLISIFS